MTSESAPAPNSQPPPVASPSGRRFNRLLPIAIFLVVCTAVAFYIWKSQTTNPSRSEALNQARAGEFDRAEAELKAALVQNPSDAEVAEALAKGYLKRDNPAETEAALDRWVALRPNEREPIRLRFEFHRKSKDLAKAYPDGRRLLELEPTNALLPKVLMVQSFSLGRFEEAEGYCRTSLGELPGDRGLRSLLAEIRRARGDLTEAGEILDRLMKDFPNQPSILLSRGVLHLDAGQPEKAVPLLREVVRTDPTRARTAGYQLAVALERTGEIDEAKRVTAEVRRLQDIANAEDAIKTQPDNLDHRTLQAEMLLAAGHAKDGVRLLEAVLTRDPAFARAHRALAGYYERIGQPDKAAEHRRSAGR